jgi:hypothetical protein
MQFFRSTVLYMALLATTLFTFLAPDTAEAVPAFARQTGMPCMSCHFQNYPALNAFGRTFRSKGYTMMGAQPLIEGEDMSLPSQFNASIITKIRYQVKGGTDRGEIQWPDEAALLVGGRAADKIGFLMELGLGPQGGHADTGDGSLSCTGAPLADLSNCTADTGTGSTEVDGNFLSTKFHFGIADSFAIVLFSTDGLGVGYGFEMMNTGVQRSQRPIENRKGFSAYQALGTASGAATGLAFVYEKPEYSVNYSAWTPTWGNVNADLFGGLAHYLRAAWTPNLGGWDTGFGVTYMTGSVKTGENDPVAAGDELFVDSWGIDAQAQGMAGSMPLGLYISYGGAPKSTATETNVYNSSTVDDNTAYGLLGKLEVISGTSLYLAYASLDAGTSTSQSTLGVQQMLAQNVKLELYTVSSDSSNSGDDYTMLMFFAGF